jgi:iron(III)-enterobactin esterase
MIRSFSLGLFLLGALFTCACSDDQSAPSGVGGRAASGGAGGSGGSPLDAAAGSAGASGSGGSSGAGGTSGASGTSGAAGSAGSAGAGATGGAAEMDARSDVGVDTGIIDPGTDGDGDLPPISPPYADKNLDVRNVPHGTVYRFTMDSNDSTIYPGLNGHYTRAVDVYIPKQYKDGTDAPFIVVQDGPGYTGRMQRALDNLISDGAAPALIAIMVNNGGGDSIGSQRGLEYDTMSDVYVTFIETEVLPAVAANSAIKAAYPNLRFTANPEGRAAMGCSSGAAAAFTMGWFGKDLYRRILSYSGTFVDQQDPKVPTFTHGAWEYHEHLIAETAPNKPLRVYLEVGENDLRANDPESTLHNWVMANQRMAAALKAKQYHYQFQFARGAGHCDAGVIGQTLYEALKWLWRGYPITPAG